jgi:phenylacetic acid degradation operon negative regulatory protein
MQQVSNRQPRTTDRDAAFSARSVVASLLLGMRHPELSGARLVQAAGLFGLSDGTTRVALSRMVGAGELVAEGGRYRLAGSLAERHGRQEEGRRPPPGAWDGTWWVAVAGSLGARRSASERAVLRRRLTAARMAEWREGVWLRPDNLGHPPGGVDGCTWWVGAQPVAAESTTLASSLWDLDGWAHRAVALGDEMAAVPPAGGIPESFRVAAAVVRHLRDDPLLPAELLPPRWPGADLRTAYDAYEVAFQAALRPFLSG